MATLTPIFENIPAELTTIPQWVNWRSVVRDGKPTKPPFQPDGRFAKSDDPSTWSSFHVCRDAAGRFDGVGFVLTGEDDIFAVDLDKCYCPAFDLMDPAAEKIIRILGTYTEKSPSRRGFRVFGKGKLPVPGAKKGRIEVYQTGRYVTVTGHKLNGHGIEHCQPELDRFFQEHFGKPDNSKTPPGGVKPLAGDIETRLKRAFSSKNGAAIECLYNGEWSGYSSQSEADLALCSHLAFWLDGDPAAIDESFRASGLFRPKWDEKHHGDGRTYGEGTIEKAIAGCSEFYGGQKRTGAQGSADTDQDAKKGTTSAPSVSVGENLTDTGNARRFVRIHGENVRYCVQWKAWLIWDGTRWRRDDDLTVERLAESVAMDLDRESSETIDKDRRNALRRAAMAAESNKKKKDLLEIARSLLAIRQEDLNKNPWLLTTRNVTLDLKNVTAFEPRREDLITKRADVLYIPGAGCPHWLNFLDMIMAGNINLIKFLQRATGYSMTGICDERCILILDGTGRNGKTTYEETIAAILDEYALRTPTSTLMAKRHDGIPNDVAALKGARFVHASETKEGRGLSEELIKDLTGTDTISARFMRGEWFTFKPEFKLWLSTNHKPVIKGTDDAIWDRIRLIPFTVRIPDDKLLPASEVKQMFAEERSGIFNWMLEGLAMWRAEKLGIPDEVREATGEYREEMDVINDFICDRCIVDLNKEVTVADLYDAYLKWSEGNREQPLAKKTFGSRIFERGFDQYQKPTGNRAKTWIGIGLQS